MSEDAAALGFLARAGAERESGGSLFSRLTGPGIGRTLAIIGGGLLLGSALSLLLAPGVAAGPVTRVAPAVASPSSTPSPSPSPSPSGGAVGPTAVGAIPGGGGATPAPVIRPTLGGITATLAPPLTQYTVAVSNPQNVTLAFAWSRTAACGEFGGSGQRAVWDHPHPPCPEEQNHPGLIQVRVTGPGIDCTAQYPNGSSQGVGAAPACPVVGGPPVVAATATPAPQGTLVPGVGGGAGTTGGPGTGGIVLGGGLVILGVAVQLRRRCDCRGKEEELRRHELSMADKERQLAAYKAWIAAAYDVMLDYSAYEGALRGWLAAYDTWHAALHPALDAWRAHAAFLRSLLGPLAVAGRHQYDTEPHPGWVQVSPALWANTEEAARAARLAQQIAELMAGGLMGLPGGMTYLSALGAAEMQVAALEQADTAMGNEAAQAYAELALCDSAVDALMRKVAEKEMAIDTFEMELEQMALARDRILAELDACLRASAPNCPPNVPVVELMEVSPSEPLPEGPRPIEPTTPPTLPGAPPPTPIGGAPATPPVTGPTAEAPTPGRTVLLTEEQRGKVNEVSAERERVRTEIREIEAKPHPTGEDRDRLTELRATERDLDVTLHNTIVREHNTNVDRIETDRAERAEEQRRSQQRLDPTDIEKVERLERERAAATDPREIERLDTEITEAKRAAVERATQARPPSTPAQPAAPAGGTAPGGTTAPTAPSAPTQPAPNPWDPPAAAPAPAPTTPSPAPESTLAAEDEARLTHQEHRISEIEREMVTLARKAREGTATPAERERLVELRREYRRSIEDAIEDYHASAARAKEAAAAAPPAAAPTTTPAVPLPPSRERVESEYNRLRDITPGPGDTISTAARRDLEAAEKKLAELETERRAGMDRLTVLMSRERRTPEEEAERERLTTRVYDSIPDEERTIVRDLLTRHPELLRLPAQPTPSTRPGVVTLPFRPGDEKSGGIVNLPARPGDGNGGILLLGTDAAGDEAVAELTAEQQRYLATMRGLAIASATRFGIVNPADPFVEFLLAIGLLTGPEGLMEILGTITTTNPAEAVVRIVLATADRVDPEQAVALLSLAYAATGEPGAAALRTEVADRLAATAARTTNLEAMSSALTILASLGRQRGTQGQALITRINEVFPESYDVDAVITTLEGDTRLPSEVAADLTAHLTALRELLDLTGDSNVRGALERLGAFAERVAASLETQITTATQRASGYGRGEEDARRLYEKVRDEKLNGGVLTLWSYSGNTPEEAAIFDRVYPDWRKWLFAEGTFSRHGVEAARRLEEPLRLRWQEFATATRRAAARVAELERLRLTLLHGDVSAEARGTAFRAAFEDAKARTERFAADVSGSGITGEELGQLTAMRARTEATQALALDSEGIQRELDDIRTQLNGRDYRVPNPDSQTGMTILKHDLGLLERLYGLDPDGDSHTVAGASESPKMSEARMLRDRIQHLQQRRVDLLLLAGASYSALQQELQRDLLYWQHRKPWQELAWLSLDTTSEAVYQQANAAYLWETPTLAWQMASARNDPRTFAEFLLTLQRAKVTRGERAFEEYRDTPWYRRGAWTQTKRLIDQAEIFEQMYETDMRLQQALQGMTSGPIESLNDDMRETLRTHGFIAEGPDGVERYAVPSRFSFDPFAVGERMSERDWTDQLFNLSSVAQLAATYYVGGAAGWLGRAYGLAEGVYAARLVYASRVAIETTAFMMGTGFLQSGNVFAPFAPLVSGRWRDVGKEWLHTAIVIGGLHKLAPFLESFNAGGLSGLRTLLRGERLALTAKQAADLRAVLSQWLARSGREALSTAAQAGYMALVDGLFGHRPTMQSITEALFALGVMRTAGVIGEPAATSAQRHARELALRAKQGQQYYETRARELFESARTEGRTELTEHERAKLATLRQQVELGTGRLDLSRELARIEATLTRDLGVRVGETTGGWRDLATDTARQREVFGRPLLEALGTRDAAAGDFAQQRWTSFKALARFMYEAGSWVGTKQELFAKHPELAKALFEARRAWSDWIRASYNATVIGTVNDVRNDCDFNFSLGTGKDFDPVPRMRAAAEWTRALVEKALIESGVPAAEARRASHETLLETNSYTDPAILHLYTRLPPELQPEVIDALTRDSIGVVRYMFEHRMHLPAEVRTRILEDLALASRETPRSADQLAVDLGVPSWTTAAGREALFSKQSGLFERYLQNPTGKELADIVREICEIQMLLNVHAEGAYPVPGAGLVTVSIKEAVLESQTAMRDLKQRIKDLKGDIGRLTDAAEIDRRRTELAGLERTYEGMRLDTIRNLTPEEALQSVLGDLVFFWHMSEVASHGLDPYDVVMRYEVSKYAARLLEVAKVFGMSPAAGTAYDFRYTPIARLLRIATQIYKSKKPHEPFGVEHPLRGQEAMRRYFEALQEASGAVIRHLREMVERRDSMRGEADLRPDPEAMRGETRIDPVPLENVPLPEWGGRAVDPAAETNTGPARADFGALPGAPRRTQRFGEWLDPTPDRGIGSGHPETQRAWVNLTSILIAEQMLAAALRGELHGVPTAELALGYYWRMLRTSLADIKLQASEDPNFWEHLLPEDAAMLQGRLREWDRTGRPIAPLEEYVRRVQQ